MVKNTIRKYKDESASYNKKGIVMSKITKKLEDIVPKSQISENTENIPEKKEAKIKKKDIKKDSSHAKAKSTTPAAVDDIKSLKDMEDKIMEKFEENKIEEPASDSAIEEKIIIHTDMDEIKEMEVKGYSKPSITSIQPHDTTDKSADNKCRIEAVLFAVGKYLDEETISQLCEIEKRNVKKSLEELRKEYDSRTGALMIVQEGDSWKINVREKFLSLVRKIVSDTELSKSVMETLSVIAWKTPVYQNEVVKIRGNKCYDHIEELENAGFITKDKKGRSYILKTTEKFYNYFDIDQKNLKGVMGEAKIPSKQSTLDELRPEKPAEQGYSREKLLHALETIETKSITHTEEDKLAQKEFLNNMHQKIEQAARNTDEVVSEIPRSMKEEEEVGIDAIEGTSENVIPPELEGNAVIEKDDEDIVIDTTDSESGEHHFQKPAEQPQKQKQLTRKQLEKKFKDELQRVKDKSSK
jgi:segregation and condensation protein B